ncbi:hypothetical protein [Rhizobium sp. FY34]|uniref:hypothetical protein n=1 Tax=Rhizobium sp. FY34 TaxID=2562309 RepID=UPI0010BF6A78|nr:hypothetical protein [Rhizobium sp. FY34]
MTTLFDIAIETARLLPPEKQDEIARLVLEMAQDDETLHVLSQDEIEGLRPSLEQAKKREFASEDEVRALWRRHGL